MLCIKCESGVRKNLGKDFDEGFANEAELQKECFLSKDHKEAVNAFREKRKPVFKGR